MVLDIARLPFPTIRTMVGPETNDQAHKDVFRDRHMSSLHGAGNFVPDAKYLESLALMKILGSQQMLPYC